MIDMGLLDRIVRVRGVASGTGLVHTVDGRHVLVTARNVIDAYADTVAIALPYDNRTLTLKVARVATQADVCAVPIDVALDLDEPGYGFEAGPVGIGEDVRVVGYPAGLSNVESLGGFRYDMPFVTRALVASPGSGDRFHLDAPVRPGFAGAPIVVAPAGGPTRIVGFASADSSELVGFSNAYRTGLALELIGEALRGIA